MGQLMDDYPDKTRLFHRPGIGRRATGGGMGPRPVCFDLLGFTHSWARSRRGYWLAKRKTASDWLNRAVQKISDWCRRKRLVSSASRTVADSYIVSSSSPSHLDAK